MSSFPLSSRGCALPAKTTWNGWRCAIATSRVQIVQQEMRSLVASHAPRKGQDRRGGIKADPPAWRMMAISSDCIQIAILARMVLSELALILIPASNQSRMRPQLRATAKPRCTHLNRHPPSREKVHLSHARGLPMREAILACPPGRPGLSVIQEARTRFCVLGGFSSRGFCFPSLAADSALAIAIRSPRCSRFMRPMIAMLVAIGTRRRGSIPTRQPVPFLEHRMDLRTWCSARSG